MSVDVGDSVLQLLLTALNLDGASMVGETGQMGRRCPDSKIPCGPEQDQRFGR